MLPRGAAPTTVEEPLESGRLPDRSAVEGALKLGVALTTGSTATERRSRLRKSKARFTGIDDVTMAAAGAMPDHMLCERLCL